ncbi:hypothetical protein Ocin01_19620, partial [Orchesella cincta]
MFNGFHGCERCTTEGHYAGRVVFLDCNSPLRTKESFEKKDTDHHTGVTRKLLYNWVYGKVPNKWRSAKVVEVSKKLIRLKAYIPAEFARKTRSLKDLKHYKATEYRLFLLFTGIVVLKDIISPEEYEMFFLLQCAVYILLSDNASDPEWNGFAKRLLVEFVERCRKIYGKVDCALAAVVEEVVRVVDVLVMSSSVGADDGNAIEEISMSVVADVEVLMNALLYGADCIVFVSSKITCKVNRTVSKTAVTALLYCSQ